MKKRQLKNINLKCPILSFGGAPIGNLFERLNNKTAELILKEAHKNGISLYDTSPFYGYGLSEKRIGSFISKLDREDFILSTKVGRYLLPEKSAKIDRGIFKGGLNYKPIIDYSYDGVMKSFEQSLIRLKVDYIDLCLIHDVDKFTHGKKFDYYYKIAMNGAYKAVQKLKDQKLVKGIGLGLNDANVANKFILEEQFDCVLLAGRYTLLERSAEEEFFTNANEKGVDIILAGIFNSGVLAKGLKNSTYFYKPIPKKILRKFFKLEKLCNQFNVPIQAAAIQYPLRKDFVKSIILGMDDVVQIKKNISFLNYKIKEEFWHKLNEIDI
tara:strand:- start:357 stop:1334 length:978 start_codon:yes stop_codon:yes gene_type:complete